MWFNPNRHAFSRILPCDLIATMQFDFRSCHVSIKGMRKRSKIGNTPYDFLRARRAMIRDVQAGDAIWLPDAGSKAGILIDGTKASQQPSWYCSIFSIASFKTKYGTNILRISPPQNVYTTTDLSRRFRSCWHSRDLHKRPRQPNTHSSN